MLKQFGAIVSGFILLLVIVVLIVLPLLAHSDSDSGQLSSHQRSFAKALLYAKGGFSLILLISSFWYSIYYPLISKKHGINTYFSVPQYQWRPLADAAVTFVFVAISVIYTLISRCADVFEFHNMIVVLSVSLILSIFVLAQETSGFNRFIARKETQQGMGNYHKIDQIVKEENKIMEKPHDDPFIDAFATTLFIFVCGSTLYAIWVMFMSALTGFNSGNYDVSKVSFFCQTNLSSSAKISFFILEIAMIVILNLTPAVLASTIRKETVRWPKIFAFGIIIVGLHLMLQYNGFLSFPIF